MVSLSGPNLWRGLGVVSVMVFYLSFVDVNSGEGGGAEMGEMA